MPPQADVRHFPALDYAIHHLAAQRIAQGEGPRDPREARRHVWRLLESRTGIQPANPNDAGHVLVLCLAALDWLAEWTPETLDLFFPVPE